MIFLQMFASESDNHRFSQEDHAALLRTACRGSDTPVPTTHPTSPRRNTFDEDRIPDLSQPSVRQDIHSVSGLLKQYLRELPNPLLTYQLYDKFVSAVQSPEDQRLIRVRDVVQQLPPPHYRLVGQWGVVSG